MFIIESIKSLPDKFLQRKKKKNKRFNFQNALTELADQRDIEISKKSEVVTEENLSEKIFRKMYRILEDLRRSEFFVNDVVIAVYPLNLFDKGDEVSVHFSSGYIFIKLEYLKKKNKIILRAGQEASYTFDKFPFREEFKVDSDEKWITQVQMKIVEVLAQEKYKKREWNLFSRRKKQE